jgi:hypothetical protein
MAKQDFLDFSFIVTTRNDNHGGNMYLKNQFFVNRWAYNVKKLDINCELIIVDWNSEKNLRNKIIIPKLNKNQNIRIIEVPNRIHKKFKNYKKLNMFQMIAKNVGARRAIGKYLILTNVDIIFSNGLLEFLKNKKLNENFIYRVDRYDINFNKFDNFKITEQSFDSNVTHINKKYYTYDVVKNIKYWTYNSFSGAIINLLKKFFEIVKYLTMLFYHIAINLLKICYFTLFKINSLTKFKLLKLKKKYFLNILKKINYIIEINYLKLITGYPKIIINDLKLLLTIIISPKLHTNACGDFQLISKKTFINLSGYYEYDGYSFHIDSILMWKAYFMGYKFKDLKFKIFHINHTDGYVNSNELFKNLKKKDINYISNNQLTRIINNLDKNMNYLNNAKFGLVDYKLNEFFFNNKQ